MYEDFFRWLNSNWFEYIISNSADDYFYNNYGFETYSKVENYYNKILHWWVRFVLWNDEHIACLVWWLGAKSDIMTIDELKQFIIDECREVKKNKLKALNSINI